MKYTRLLILALGALSLTISGCQNDTLTNPPISPGQIANGITPGPKGQKVPLLPRDNSNLSAPTPLNQATAEKSVSEPVLTAPALARPTTGAIPSQQDGLGEGQTSTLVPVPENSPIPTAPPDGEGSVPPRPEPTPIPSAEPTPLPSSEPQQTRYFYFSYDDSASTAGVELTKYALKQGFAPNPAWARPWEFLNYEKFARQNQTSTGLFQVSMGVWQHGSQPGQETGNTYDLGIHVSAPALDPQERPNLVLTLVVDVSGSMNEPTPLLTEGGTAPSLLDVAKSGLETLASHLKPGDVIHLVSFSHSAQVVLENFSYQGDATAYLQAVRSLQTLGGTNLNAGITTAYQLAQKSYQPGKLNRVLLLTDAYANMGEVDPQVIAQHTRINNAEGIYFSGLGFGQNFNEAFLNQLTEAGRGAYFSVITQKDAQRAFQERLMALMTVAARDVQFRLDYPAMLKHIQSAAEESAQVQREVQPTNFSYNTSQYFWERFQASDEANLLDQPLKLTIYYTDPHSGEKKQEIYERRVREVLGKDLNNIKDARMITLLTSLIKKEITKEQAQFELEHELGDHASALATEYRRLIESWFKLSS